MVPQPRNGGTLEQYNKAVAYLNRSPAAAAVIQRLESNSQVFTVFIDPTARTAVNGNAGEITWNPTAGMVVGENEMKGVASPARGLVHEFKHLDQILTLGRDGMVSALLDYVPVYGESDPDDPLALGPILHMLPRAEQEATAFENQVADELGETAKRDHYADSSGYVNVPDSTFSCEGEGCHDGQ